MDREWPLAEILANEEGNYHQFREKADITPKAWEFVRIGFL
jgi:hypothetical protein